MRGVQIGAFGDQSGAFKNIDAAELLIVTLPFKAETTFVLDLRQLLKKHGERAAQLRVAAACFRFGQPENNFREGFVGSILFDHEALSSALF